MRTERQRRGAAAEASAAAYLGRQGWHVLERNVKVGRDEIDILALDPGPPAEIVCVEVRSASSPVFGSPEERIDRVKVGHLYRAMRSLVDVPRLPRRVDLVVVDARDGAPRFRHHRRLEPV